MSRRTTITIPEELDDEIRDYLDQYANGLTLSKLIQTALREYLTQRAIESESVFVPTRRTLRITPAERRSGFTDTSINHDKYLAEFIYERKLPPRVDGQSS